MKTGLVVDSVREVLNLARKDIAPPPEAIGSGIDQQFISGIGKVDAGKRMIVLLDVEKNSFAAGAGASGGNCS